MKNSNSFFKLLCLIPALLIACMVNLKAQDELIGYTFVVANGNSYYYISNCETTWEEANEAATEMGGHLATLTSHFEIFTLPSWILNHESFYTDKELIGIWIGLRGIDGIYEWANGEPNSTFFWSANNEPVYADGATLIAPLGYDDYNSWFTHPISGEAVYLVEFSGQPNCSNNPNKTYVCHNGNTICISVSALQSHLDHGCLEGPCGPCNLNAMQASPGKVEASKDHEHHALNKTLSEEDESVHGRKLSNQIQIYPNPASEQIQVLLPEGIREGTLRILSKTGQVMHNLTLSNQESVAFDLSSYIQGLYLIEVQTINGRYHKTFVKL